MSDRLFKLFFTASAASPMLLCSAVIVLWRNGPQASAICLLLTGLLLSLVSPLFLGMTGRRRSRDIILPQNVRTSSADLKIAAAVVMTWVIPLSEMLLHHEMLLFWTIFGIVMFFLLSYSESCIPNVWFFLLGYHCYEVETENGTGLYYLLSRRINLSDPDSTCRITAVSGSLLIEVGIRSAKESKHSRFSTL
ncbi:MAG: hypothetical protein ACI3XM_08100 [Eubacteriales bacterium]